MTKDMFESWRAYLAEDKDDPTYAQETYNAFVLLALSNERGGNRDEVKNDIRAIPEVLTVTPVERIDGGVQKQLGDHFLSTMKLRVRLPRGVQRDILSQQLVNDINQMRGVTVRRHTSETGTEMREEQDYQKSPARKASLKRGWTRLTQYGPNDSGPYTKVTDKPEWKSAPPGAPGGGAIGNPGPAGLEEGEGWDDFKKWTKEKATGIKDIATGKGTTDWKPGKVTGPPIRPPDPTMVYQDEWGPVDRAREATPEELGIGDVEEETFVYADPIDDRPNREEHTKLIGNELGDYRRPVTDTAYQTSKGQAYRTDPKKGGTAWHAGDDWAARTRTWLEDEERGWKTASDAEMERMQKRWTTKKKEKGLEFPEPGSRDYQSLLKDVRHDIIAPANMQIIGMEKSKGPNSYGIRLHGMFYDYETKKHYRTSFNHLESLPTHIKVGDYVKSGDTLARMGNTGRSKGVHLHHEVGEASPEQTEAFYRGVQRAMPPGERSRIEYDWWGGAHPDDRGFDAASPAARAKYAKRDPEKDTRGGRYASWKAMLDQSNALMAQRGAEEEAMAARKAAQEAAAEAGELDLFNRYNSYPIREVALKTEACPQRPKKKVKIKIRPGGGKLITSFEVQPNLNSTVWEGDTLRPDILERLREIAEEFITKLDLPNVDIKDIILTGSLANYNWSEYSDLDVHIVVDFRDVAEDEGFVKKYFDAVRANWNRNHDIKVKGFEVELYVEDDDESHESTGIYSLLTDEWILKPVREHTEIDKVNIFKKARHIMRDIDKVERYLDGSQYDAALELGQKTKDKIKKMRRGGLQSGGIYSTENLAFKVLRRGGYMGKLLDSVGTAYDAQRSLAEQE